MGVISNMEVAIGDFKCDCTNGGCKNRVIVIKEVVKRGYILGKL